MPTKIPATVVTGFLGAGKTTLIRNLLRQADGRRIALIVNEFGDVGVDGSLLEGCGDAACADDDIVELANGCICCTVAEDFVPTMKKLVERADPPEHIVIETSGLALPQPLVRAFAWPEIRNRVTVDGVVTVVDGPAVAEGRFAADEARVEAARQADDALDHETPLADLFEDQLACADMIVLSKTDAMEEGAASASAERVTGQARHGVRLVRSSADGLAPNVLLGLGAGAEADMAARHERHHHHHDDEDDHHEDADHHHHHDHDDFDSFVLTLPEAADADALKAKVARACEAEGVLRIKGFAAVAGKPMRLVVQAVGPRVDAYFDRPHEGERATRLVVIGLAGMDRGAVEAALG